MEEDGTIKTLFELCVQKIAKMYIEDVTMDNDLIDLSWLDTHMLNNINKAIVKQMKKKQLLLEAKLTVNRRIISICTRHMITQEKLNVILINEIQDRDQRLRLLIEMLDILVTQ